jgi:hypothetical protein
MCCNLPNKAINSLSFRLRRGFEEVRAVLKLVGSIIDYLSNNTFFFPLILYLIDAGCEK